MERVLQVLSMIGYVALVVLIITQMSGGIMAWFIVGVIIAVIILVIPLFALKIFLFSRLDNRGIISTVLMSVYVLFLGGVAISSLIDGDIIIGVATGAYVIVTAAAAISTFINGVDSGYSGGSDISMKSGPPCPECNTSTPYPKGAGKMGEELWQCALCGLIYDPLRRPV